MKLEQIRFPWHRRDGENRLLPDTVSDDPVGIAAALIEIRKPFVVALAMGQKSGTEDHPEAMAVFATDGSLLAGRLAGPRAWGRLARAAADCFRQRLAVVIELQPDEPIFGASAARGATFKVYVEPILWT
jgi:hypothetical protein